MTNVMAKSSFQLAHSYFFINLLKLQIRNKIQSDHLQFFSQKVWQENAQMYHKSASQQIHA